MKRVGSATGAAAAMITTASAFHHQTLPITRRRGGVWMLHRRRTMCSSSNNKNNLNNYLLDFFFNKTTTKNTQHMSTKRRLTPGTLSPRRPVPDHILLPPYVVNVNMPPGISSAPQLHDNYGIHCMRASGRLAAQVLQHAATLVMPGITTDEIDQAVHQMIVANGAYPSPLGYGGFPKSVCTSVNECICHGIPDSRPLEDGDIINIDVTVYLNGYHGDTSATFLCGEVDDEAKKLVQVTKESLDKAISICAPGVEFKKIGKTIQEQ